MQIYVDMDGVLADFDRHYLRTFGKVPTRPGGTDWKAIRVHEGFYAGIPPMPDMNVLWGYLRPHKPIVLTGIPSNVPEAKANKQEWIKKYLPLDTKVIYCQAKNKYKNCLPGDLLIDDYDKHKQAWLSAGGLWIDHTSAKFTCAQLYALEIYPEEWR